MRVTKSRVFEINVLRVTVKNIQICHLIWSCFVINIVKELWESVFPLTATKFMSARCLLPRLNVRTL